MTVSTHARITIRDVIELDPADQFIVEKDRTGRRHKVESMSWSVTITFDESGLISNIGHKTHVLRGRNVKIDGSLGAAWREEIYSMGYQGNQDVQRLRDEAGEAAKAEALRWTVRRRGN